MRRTRESSRETMSGPPANPSFTPTGIPGTGIGMLPINTPSAMPKNSGMMRG
jgi:hypothetical protein